MKTTAIENIMYIEFLIDFYNQKLKKDVDNSIQFMYTIFDDDETQIANSIMVYKVNFNGNIINDKTIKISIDYIEKTNCDIFANELFNKFENIFKTL